MEQYHRVPHGGNEAPGKSHIDPVCGMSVTPTTAAGKHEYNGKSWYFCGLGCLNKFKADPLRYIAREAGESQKDPVCGMDVIPEKAAGMQVPKGGWNECGDGTK